MSKKAKTTKPGSEILFPSLAFKDRALRAARQQQTIRNHLFQKLLLLIFLVYTLCLGVELLF